MYWRKDKGNGTDTYGQKKKQNADRFDETKLFFSITEDSLTESMHPK